MKSVSKLFTKTTNENMLIETSTENSAFLKGQFIPQPPTIIVQPSLKLLLDLTRFWIDFDRYYNVYNGLVANVISLLIDGNCRYRISLSDNENKKELSPSTLEPIDDSKPLVEFKHSDEFMVVVGSEKIESKEYIVNPMWIGMINVLKPIKHNTPPYFYTKSKHR